MYTLVYSVFTPDNSIKIEEQIKDKYDEYISFDYIELEDDIFPEKSTVSFDELQQKFYDIITSDFKNFLETISTDTTLTIKKEELSCVLRELLLFSIRNNKQLMYLRCFKG